MVAVSSMSTITAQEREAMAGLLQLQEAQDNRVQDIPPQPSPAPTPTPQVQPTNTDDNEYMDTATAAWVLTRCFSPNKTSSPNESVANQTSATEASGEDSSSNNNNQACPQKCCHSPKRCRVDLKCLLTCCCCCCHIHASKECNRCGQKAKTRDVGIQTDEFPTEPVSIADAPAEVGVASRLEKLIRESKKRKNISPDELALVPKSPKLALPGPSVSIITSENSTPEVKPKTPIHKTKKSPAPKIIEIEKPPIFNEEDLIDSDEEWQPTEVTKKSKPRRRYTTSGSNKENMDVSEFSELDDTMDEQRNTKSEQDLIPIGDGNAKIPARLLKHMNWSSYTNVTRKLLTAVFPRSVLATHSLTGKPSPAFPNKPAKKKLDAALVNDIVQTVVERCGVPENVVRTSITTKCADESKMFRTRERNKKSKNT